MRAITLYFVEVGCSTLPINLFMPVDVLSRILLWVGY